MIVLFYFVLNMGLGRYWPGLLRRLHLAGLHPYLSASLRLMVLLAALLLLMQITGESKKVFGRPGRGPFLRGLIPGAYMLAFSAASVAWNLLAVPDPQFRDAKTILFSALYFFLVAVTEELVFRGVAAGEILTAVSRRAAGGGIFLSVLLSGILFALAHLQNLRSAGPAGVCIQMLGALLMGMVLTAVYYRSANLWTVIFIHFVNDLAAAFPVTVLKTEQSRLSGVINGYGMTDVLLLLPYLAVLAVILRKRGREEIREHFL